MYYNLRNIENMERNSYQYKPSGPENNLLIAGFANKRITNCQTTLYYQYYT